MPTGRTQKPDVSHHLGREIDVGCRSSFFCVCERYMYMYMHIVQDEEDANLRAVPFPSHCLAEKMVHGGFGYEVRASSEPFAYF